MVFRSTAPFQQVPPPRRFRLFSGLPCHPLATPHGLIEESRAADTCVHQMDIGREREAGVGVAEPGLHLLHIPPGLKEQTRAGVAEGVEGDRRAGPLSPSISTSTLNPASIAVGASTRR